MNSEAYWKKRRINQTPAELSAIAVLDKMRMCTYVARRSRELQRAFAQTQREISGMIEAFYKKYAGENGISLSDAKTYLTSAETKITLEEYYILVKQALGGDAQADALLNAAQKRRQITRLQALGMQLDGHAKLLGKTAQNIMQGTFEAVAEESYLRQIYDVQKAMGYGTGFTTLNRAKLRELCNRTWQGNRNWSQRIWGHVENLGEELERTLRLGISTGQSSRDMAAQLSARVGVARSRCMTLIRTEAARITEDATLAGYVETGVEEYQFLATLDNRTSPACQKLDMRHFPVEEAVTGRNYPPMHPNCRSTTVVYFGDEDDAGTRIARGDDGKTYEVPGDMTYEQWKRQYGDGKSGAEEKGVEKDMGIQYNADGTILVTDDWKDQERESIPVKYKPYAVVETKVIHRNGTVQVNRSIYDSAGMLKTQIHSGPHNRPDKHPYGEHGEHAHDYYWAKDGTRKNREIRELTEIERGGHRDIL